MKTNELIEIKNPDGNATVAQLAHNMVVERERELKAEFAAIAEKLTPESFGETKAEWTRLKKMDGELKDIIDRVEADALKYAKADALLFQLRATRKNLKAVYDASWAKFVELRDADKPDEPTHTYFYAVTCTDAEHGAVQKAMAKVGAKFDVVSPQKDAEWRTAAKLFGVKE